MFKTIHHLFLEHPAENNVSYFQHMIISLNISVTFLLASSQAFVHAFLPFMFKTTSTDTIKYMEVLMKNSYK